jgi:hypothetical protein
LPTGVARHLGPRPGTLRCLGRDVRYPEDLPAGWLLLVDATAPARGRPCQDRRPGLPEGRPSHDPFVAVFRGRNDAASLPERIGLLSSYLCDVCAKQQPRSNFLIPEGDGPVSQRENRDSPQVVSRQPLSGSVLPIATPCLIGIPRPNLWYNHVLFGVYHVAFQQHSGLEGICGLFALTFCPTPRLRWGRQ